MLRESVRIFTMLCDYATADATMLAVCFAKWCDALNVIRNYGTTFYFFFAFVKAIPVYPLVKEIKGSIEAYVLSIYKSRRALIMAEIL